MLAPAFLLLDARLVSVAAHLRGEIMVATSSGTVTWRDAPRPGNDNRRIGA